MIGNKRPRISIVIPVYNEEQSLAECLERIARQSVQPHEVIVVDNNSTDDTAAIALRYRFVTLVREPRQGVVHARTAGFDAATGDVIGRIDADTLLDERWVEVLQELFQADTELAAVTGKVSYYNLALPRLVDAVDFRIRKRLARLMGREVALQGANMALRRSGWQSVRGRLCQVGDLHEDYDLAIHLTQAGRRVVFDDRLQAAISFRQAKGNWRNFAIYALISPRTYARHRLKSQRHMYPVVGLVIACYPLLRLLHKGYDSETARFSWRQLFSASAVPRVNPATFVD